MRLIFAVALATMTILSSGFAAAESGPSAAPTSVIAVQNLPPPVATSPSVSPQAGFDAVKATNAYLAQVHGAARARSDSYFEGGYILILVDAIYAVSVSAILLWLGLSARMRDIATRVTNRRFWQVPIYVALYTILTVAMN